MISAIPKSEVSKLWDVASGYVEKAWAEAPGYYRSVDILDRILNDIELLWGVFDDEMNMIAAFTTQIEEYPLGRKLVISSLAGADIKSWYADMMEVMERYAKTENCTTIIARGREGWRGIGKNSKWKHTASVYEYPL